VRNTTIYNQSGTITFRRSSSGFRVDLANKIKLGTNLQNIEKYARRLYHADGYNAETMHDRCAAYLKTRDLGLFTEEERKRLKILAQTDQAGAEAKIVAYLCRKGKFRDLFLYGVKPHVFVALHLFSKVWEQRINKTAGDLRLNIEELLNSEIQDLHKHPFWKQLDKLIKSSDKWPSHERYYYIAKQVCHSSNYGIRPSAFQLNTLEKSKGKIVLSKGQAEEYLLFYHSLFPEIQEWHRWVQRQVESTRYVYNLFGFPRYFSGEINETMLKDAYAHCPQSTVGEITARCFCDLQDFTEEHALSWDNLADTHDSVLSQCPIGEEIECCKMQKLFMEQTLTSPSGEQFQMGSESVYGFNWAPYSEENNPIGLMDI
jgi:hypothetical protein